MGMAGFGVSPSIFGDFSCTFGVFQAGSLRTSTYLPAQAQLHFDAR
jgi:hypothetical protein